MNIRIGLPYLLAFFSFFFLLNECHDWIHFLVAAIPCGCFGSKGFENWTPCKGCIPSEVWLVIIWLSGPALNYILIWAGWRLMDKSKSVRQQSAGLSLLLVPLPLARILAALSGGGDETYVMRMLFAHADNKHIAAISGLLLVLILTLPPLVRAFLRMPGWKAKFLWMPAMLYLPILIDHAVVRYILNPLLSKTTFSAQPLPGIPALVLVWGLCWLLLTVLTRKRLGTLLEKTS